jgi:hypothetical protein
MSKTIKGLLASPRLTASGNNYAGRFTAHEVQWTDGLKELQGLYPLPAAWPPTTGIEPRLKKVFPALQSAVATYRPFIPKSEQSAFDEAWLVYRTATKREIDTQSYTHYMNMTSTTVSSFGGETVLPNDGKATFKRNVDRLLSFAQDV